jgi:hypothetical protein
MGKAKKILALIEKVPHRTDPDGTLARSPKNLQQPEPVHS